MAGGEVQLLFRVVGLHVRTLKLKHDELFEEEVLTVICEVFQVNAEPQL